MFTLVKKVKELLKKREFVNVATCDFFGRPNAAPKFVLKQENKYIYLVDYTIGKTWENLKTNPKVSLSLMDSETLTGYQINGSVELIEQGPLYNKMVREFREREICLSAQRVVEGLYRGQKHESFEVVLPEKIVIFKVKMQGLVEIGSGGNIRRHRL